MKFLKEWLRSAREPESSAEDAGLPPAGADLQQGQESQDATPDLASSGWLDTDSVDSSIFDSTRPTAAEPEDRDLVPHEERASEYDALSSAEKDKGYDPYDTGRFYVQKAASGE